MVATAIVARKNSLLLFGAFEAAFGAFVYMNYFRRRSLVPEPIPVLVEAAKPSPSRVHFRPAWHRSGSTYLFASH